MTVVVALGLSLGSPVIASVEVLFEPYAPLPFMVSSGEPNSLVHSQLIGDASPDFALASVEDSKVEIWLQAHPRFYLVQTLYMDDYPRFIVAADFNGDGDLELATSNTHGDNVSLFRKTDVYEYELQANYPSGIMPWDLATADFTGDDLPDLIVANGWDYHVTLFSGSLGLDGFSSVRQFPCGYGPGTVIPGDFDDDGIVELVVLREDDGLMVYMENDGVGGFIHHGFFEVGDGVRDVSVMDLNGDAYSDLAVAAREEGRVYLLENHFGQLTAAPGDPAPIASHPLTIAPNPFNPETRVHYRVESAGALIITIHDLSGRKVRDLYDGDVTATAGSMEWDGRDDRGNALASGVYAVRMIASGAETGAKAILLK